MDFAGCVYMTCIMIGCNENSDGFGWITSLGNGHTSNASHNTWLLKTVDLHCTYIFTEN